MGGELVLQACDGVGESAVWDDQRGRLVWVDIIGRRVQAFDPVSREHTIWPLSGRPTSIGLRADGGAILGMERQICLWDWHGDPHPLAEVEPDLPANRLNEGVVGPDGAYWVGTMFNNINDDDSARDIAQTTGKIYRYTVAVGVQRVCDESFGITNTLAFPDRHHLLTADTLANAIYRYDIAADGHLSERKVLHTGFARGAPDGSCLDSQGRLWTARVAGGACLTCLSPDGQLQAVVDLPCLWPTSCAFGGPDLATLFVTSARFTLSRDHLAANSHEGGLFALNVGARGLPPYRFGDPHEDR